MVKEHGEIYKEKNGNIYMWDAHINDAMYYFGGNCDMFCKNGGSFRETINVKITNEEKAWLSYCIGIDRFIKFKEFLKIYKPVYELW